MEDSSEKESAPPVDSTPQVIPQDSLNVATSPMKDKAIKSNGSTPLSITTHPNIVSGILSLDGDSDNVWTDKNMGENYLTNVLKQDPKTPISAGLLLQDDGLMTSPVVDSHIQDIFTRPSSDSPRPSIPTDASNSRPGSPSKLQDSQGFPPSPPKRDRFPRTSMMFDPKRASSLPKGSSLSSLVQQEQGEISSGFASGRESASASYRRFSFMDHPHHSGTDSPKTPPSSIHSANDDESANFLIARLDAQKNTDTNKLTSGFDPFSFIKSSFNAVRDTMMAQQSNNKEEEIDWDFWGRVMSDFDKVAQKEPRLLTRKMQLGIPSAIRGMVWQLFSKGKNPELEATYATLQNRTSTHEKLIQRDLSRTFPKHDYFQPDGPGQEALFNVIKAYSLYDPEVGYCQGISFVVGALLLNMPEEEAFCVLVQLMKQYNFRELYTPNMVGLRMRLYQFEHVLKEHLPSVDKHLENEGVKSTMYASQWFMTMFAYRFPLEFVFRIMDMIFAEGIESMFRIAVALLKKNKETILSMDFEAVVEYLKNGLFDVYMHTPTINLIADAVNVRISKSKLDKLQSEFQDILKKETDVNEIGSEELRTQNRHMNDQLKKLESAYELLNREHIDLANIQVEKSNLIEKLEHRIEELQEQVQGLKSVVQDDRRRAEDVVREEMDGLMQKNLVLTRRNVELQDALTDIHLFLTTLSHRVQEDSLKSDILHRISELSQYVPEDSA